MGKLTFTDEYPWKPPRITMTTESGRFKVNEPICLSISEHHPESWDPTWTIRSIIIGLISFFLTDPETLGSIETTFSYKEKVALESKEAILKN